MDANKAWTNLAPVAEEQWGHFTTKQALAAGFSRTQLSRMKQHGRIENERPGSYRIVGAPQDWHTLQRFIWAELVNQTAYPGPGLTQDPPPVIFGFDSAADYHDLGCIMPYSIDVIATEPIRPKHPTVRVKDTELRDRHWLWYDGMPIVSPMDAVIDQCRQSRDGDLVGRMIADVLENHVTNADDLACHLAPFAKRYGYKNGVEMILLATQYGGRQLHPDLIEHLESIKPAEG